MKAIIFDVDNTLIDLKPEYIESMRDLIKEMNYDYSDEVIEKIYKYAVEHEKNFEKINKQEMLDYINKNCNTNLSLEFIDRLEIKQGENIYDDSNLIKVIDYLSKKYDLYVVSNWFTKTQSIRLEKMGVLKYFKKVYGADINYYKPDKRVFDVILKDYKPEDCISIGDSLNNDVKLPISLGMNALWRTKEKSKEYHTFENLTELMNLL